MKMLNRYLNSITLILILIFISSSSIALADNGSLYSENQIKDLCYRVMNFVAFFAILFFLLRKPLKKHFNERSENIARNLEYLETQARNLEEQNEIMNKQIADIAAERDAILAHHERMGQKEAERIIEEANANAAALIEKAQNMVDLEIISARKSLIAEIARLSTQAAEKMVKKTINNDDQNRLTRDFISQIEKLNSVAN